MGCGRSKVDHEPEATEKALEKKATAYNAPPVPAEAAGTLRAAMLIQAWYRRYLAKLEIKRRATWTIFQSLEYAGEQDMLKLSNFFRMLLLQTEVSGAESGLISTLNQGRTSHQPSVADYASAEEIELGLENPVITVKSDYKGPHVKFPVTSRQLDVMMDAFKDKQVLHLKYLLDILLHTRHALKKLSTVQSVRIPTEKSSVTVVGDLHGQLDDLLLIFYKNGVPSNENMYLFNGDYVDRGPQSVEVAVILFSFFLLYPSAVFLNRGNHEDHEMNLRYGFVKEVIKKYRDDAYKVIKLFEDVFSWLPLATVIEDSILVAHGGISDQTEIPYLDTIDRHRYLSALRPPLFTEKERATVDAKEWRQVLDVLWSDPKHQDGCEANTFRGGGTYWGPDITNEILSQHKYQLIIRSHECKPEGYEYTHENKVLTVFSASNYYEDGSNKGAYIKVGMDKVPRIFQYIVSKATQAKLTQRQRVSMVEDSAMKSLREKVYANRSKLMEEFQALDPDDTGNISITDWCTVMERVLGLKLPWRSLRTKLVQSSDKGVQYKTTFDHYVLENKLKQQEKDSVDEVLYRHKDNLETIFRAMDTDNSGTLSMTEFEAACVLLNKYASTSLSSTDIESMGKTLDLNGDGLIDFNEFLEAFRLVDQSSI